jgi:lambda family phage portal protein
MAQPSIFMRSASAFQRIWHAALNKPSQFRRFEGAKSSRLTGAWGVVSTQIDQEVKNDLNALRARSRELTLNDDYARKFIHMVAANVVGPSGFVLQSQVMDPTGKSDTAARKAVELAFYNWSQVGNCETSNKFSFAEFCRLYAKNMARDGEVLIRRVRDSKFEFGYKLQMLDIDRLDVMHNELLTNGNVVRMGVELDTYGAPAAYWILTRHPGEYMARTEQNYRERIPANEIFHNFIADRPEQTRGFPWMASAMQSMKMLAGFREASLINARVAATKMGFFVSPDGSAADLSDGKDDEGNFTTEAAPGTFDVIPQGYDFKSFNPEFPTQNFDAFVKSCIRSISSGLGISYNGLANDLENVNFSSIRAGVLEERESWMVIQNHMIETFLRPLLNDWLQTALLKGKVTTFNGSALPAGKLDKFTSHIWQGRRWQWVDPKKDIEASVQAIQAGLATPQSIAAQMGMDLEDIIDGIAQANQMAVDAGLPAYYTAPPAPQAAPAPEDNSNKALIEAMAARSLDPQTQPSVNVRVGIDNQQMTDMAREIQDVAQKTLDQIREDVQNMPIVIPAPVVNVAAPHITVTNNVEPTPVTLEANIQPADVNITMPARITETTVSRDANGDMVGSIAVEKDI